jgi:hypothetical protein
MGPSIVLLNAILNNDHMSRTLIILMLNKRGINASADLGYLVYGYPFSKEILPINRLTYAVGIYDLIR